MEAFVKRTLATSMLLAMLLIGSAIPASAHNLTVTPNGGDNHVEGWVGTDLELLIENTPILEKHPDPFTLFAPHAGGLNAACAGTESNDVVDIRGPGGPNCPHGQ
jgi:hypothetical protein